MRRALGVVLCAGLAHASSACCSSQGSAPIIGDSRTLLREDVVRQFGEPRDSAVGTIESLLREKDLRDTALAARARRLDPNLRAEYVLWEQQCWLRGGSYFVGLFDPESGRLLTLEGQALYASRTPAS